MHLDKLYLLDPTNVDMEKAYDAINKLMEICQELTNTIDWLAKKQALTEKRLTKMDEDALKRRLASQ